MPTFSVPHGMYYFASGNDPVQEAEHFQQIVGELDPGEFLALDFEIEHPAPVAWCLAFLTRCQQLFGVKPLLYTNDARVTAYDWSPVVSQDYALWVADYFYDGSPNHQVATGAWPAAAMYQYSSSGHVGGISGPVDLDVFYGDIEALKKYGKQEDDVTPEQMQQILSAIAATKRPVTSEAYIPMVDGGYIGTCSLPVWMDDENFQDFVIAFNTAGVGANVNLMTAGRAIIQTKIAPMAGMVVFDGLAAVEECHIEASAPVVVVHRTMQK